MSNAENIQSRFPLPILVVAAAAIVAVVILFGRFCSSAVTIDVEVNDVPLTLHGAKTMETAIRECGKPINPGDLISLRGVVLKRSAGEPFYATVNGKETSDPNYQLRDGDRITLEDGKDVVEDYETETEILPHEARVGGVGTICTFTPGEDGILEKRTGKLSGETVRRITQESSDAVGMWYRPDVGDDKVIALTFDEGPSETYTSKILDVLAENDAQATFFCDGEEAEEHPDLVKREWDSYHQVGAHSYDRNIGYYTDSEEVLDIIHKSLEEVSNAIGEGGSTRIVRLSDLGLTNEVAAGIDADVDAVVSWTLDTGDWMEINSDEVYEVLIAAKPGDIVVMRDGGGNRSGTVTALQRALPELKRKGYSFITIDRLMQYPAQQTQ